MDKELERAMKCPRWNTCPAAVCPLLPLQGIHLAGEPTCLWLRELYKHGGRRRLRGVLDAELLRAIETAAPDVLARHSSLKNAVDKASRTPSKLRRPGMRGAA